MWQGLITLGSIFAKKNILNFIHRWWKICNSEREINQKNSD
jgi:hypothetical protein